MAFSHNLGHVVPPELHAAHPEFFPLVEGKRLNPGKGVLYWNPDIARPDVATHAVAKAREFFETKPHEPSFALGVNDALIWGESSELRALATPPKWFRERPDYSDVVFTFMNRVADELNRTHPKKYVGGLAYYWSENLPSFPLHPQVIPFLTADRSQGYDGEFWREEMDLQRRWGSVAGNPRRNSALEPPDFGPSTFHPPRSTALPPRRLGLYDYIYGGGFLIPRIHPKYISEHLRHAWRAGFTDYFAEVNPNWGLDGPMPWLVAQLLSDPEQSANTLLDEYYTRYYREAHAPMRRFFARCEELWSEQPGPSYWLKHYRNESQAVVFPAATLVELRGYLDDALQRAMSATTRGRVQLVSGTFGVTERFVRFKESRDALIRTALRAPLAPADETFFGDSAPKAPGINDPRPITGNLSSGLAVYLALRREFIAYTRELQRTQPLALHPFGWDDYLKNDPVPLARSALDPELVASATREVLVDPGMAGALQPKRMIADLTYGVALPAPWLSKVEPSQHHEAGLVGPPQARALKISGTKDTTVQQWAAVRERVRHVGEIAVRGRVSPGTAVQLVFAYLDANGKHLSFKSVRLPDGDWPEFVTLRQFGDTPAAAAWVGLGIRVQNQVPGDWIEAREFSLRY